jgi:hypothetical protein
VHGLCPNHQGVPDMGTSLDSAVAVVKPLAASTKHAVHHRICTCNPETSVLVACAWDCQ